MSNLAYHYSKNSNRKSHKGYSRNGNAKVICILSFEYAGVKQFKVSLSLCPNLCSQRWQESQRSPGNDFPKNLLNEDINY